MVTVAVIGLTVFLGLLFGIVAGYAVIAAILSIFARTAQPSKPAPGVLVEQASSGD